MNESQSDSEDLADAIKRAARDVPEFRKRLVLIGEDGPECVIPLTRKPRQDPPDRDINSQPAD